MPLVVENGSGVARANSYIDLAYADAYHLERLNVAWAGTTAEKEAAIIRATEFVDGRYRLRFKGEKVYATQRRCWPRYNVPIQGYFVGGVIQTNGLSMFPPDQIPDAVKDAVCEAALRAISGPLFQDLPRGGRIKKKKTDVLETEYFAGASSVTSYEIIDALLSDFIKGQTTTEIIRA